MAMLFIDGFDYLTAGNLGLKWDGTTGAGITMATGVYGRGKYFSNPTNGSSATKTLTSNLVTGFQGFHFFYGVASAATICEFRETGVAQCDLRVNAAGAMFFTRNGTTIGSTTATGTMVAGQWYWIEVKVTISTTAGVAECKLNGNFVLNSGVTNLNTQNTANTYFNQVKIGFSPGQGIDSYHMWDGSAGDVTTYFGEHIIDTQLPNATGTNAAWTKNGGTNNFDRVNEANEDGDTSYNSSATANQIDSFNFPSLTETSGTIATVAVNTIDRDDDATPRTFDHYVLNSGSSALSAPISPGANYVNHQSFFGTDPNTSAAWTITGWNAAEFGYKEIS